ncbi:MAG: hypothetical protein AAF533_11440 [Acidobacteriota bacterium]
MMHRPQRPWVLTKALATVVLLIASRGEVEARSFEEKDWRRVQIRDLSVEVPFELQVKTDTLSEEQLSELLAHDHLTGGPDDFFVSITRVQGFPWQVPKDVDETVQTIARTVGVPEYRAAPVDIPGLDARYMSYHLEGSPTVIVETMLADRHLTEWIVQVYYVDSASVPASKRILESLRVSFGKKPAAESPPEPPRASTQPAQRASTQPAPSVSTQPAFRAPASSGWSSRRHGSLHYESPFALNEDLGMTGQLDESTRRQIESMTTRAGTMQDDLAAMVREIVYVRGSSFDFESRVKQLAREVTAMVGDDDPYYHSEPVTVGGVNGRRFRYRTPPGTKALFIEGLLLHRGGTSWELLAYCKSAEHVEQARRMIESAVVR